MAEFFCDHGAYPAYTATPTWGVAQDGDGLGLGLATPAVAVIDCDAVTAAAGASVAVAGATLTCVASGAVANQFNAGSGAALATALVSSINAATATVGAGVSITLPQLRSWAFARIDPGNSSRVQIMTRAGSATFNHAGNTAVAIAVAGFAPTLTQFAGGASGCWGYLWNDAIIWPASLAIGAYGAIKANAVTGGGLLASTRALTSDDWVWLPARNQALLYSARTISVITPFQMVVDSADEKWAGTAGKEFRFGHDASTGGAFLLSCQPVLAASPLYFALCSNRSNAVVFQNACTQTNTASNAHAQIQFQSATSGRALFEGAKFDDISPYAYRTGLVIENNWTGNKTVYFRRGSARWSRASGLFGLCNEGSSPVGTVHISVDGFDAVLEAATAHNGVFPSVGGQYTQVTAKNCRANSPGGSIKISSAITDSRYKFLRCENLEGFDLVTTGLFGLQTCGIDAGFSTQMNVGPAKRSRIETAGMLVEWLPGSAFPTLSSQLEDGTPWSWRLTWAASATIYAGAPVDQVTLVKRAPLTNAVRTISVEVLVDPAAAGATSDHISASVSYTDSTGVLRTESTAPTGVFRAAASLPASAAAWDLGGYASHLARTLSVPTTYPVKGGTDVSVTVQFASPSPTAPSYVFVDPNFEVA